MQVSGGSRLTTIYISPIVHSLSLEELDCSELSCICVNSKGVIDWIEKITSLSDIDLGEILSKHNTTEEEVNIIRLEEGFLCPGLIDTHTHAPQYPNLGLGSDLQLLDWLDKVTFPTEAKFNDMSYAEGVYREVIRRTVDAGTTTSCYYATIHQDSTKLLADLCTEIGQRAFIGKCCMDRNAPLTYCETLEASISDTKSFLSHFDKDLSSTESPLVQPILTPRFAISCSPSLLSSLSEISTSRNPSIPIQTHMSENPLEIAWVKELFSAEAKGQEWGETYAGVYDHYGLLGPGTILAHCVHLDKREKEIIKRTGAGVSHCPASNLSLSSGAARIRDLLDMDIKVGLGTDCSGGPSVGILSSIRAASYISKFLAFPSFTPVPPPPPNEMDPLPPPRLQPLSTPNLFYLATMGGAALCRLDHEIGNFLPGKEFDALWVRPKSPGVWVEKGQGVREVFEKWIWGGDDRDLGAVWVRGRKVGGVEP